MNLPTDSRSIAIQTVPEVAFSVALLHDAGAAAVELATNWPADDPIARLAVHESGHVALAIALGRIPTSVTVRASGSGETRFSEARDGESPLTTDAEHLSQLDAVLELGGDAPLDRAAVREEAKRILRENWGFVECLASNLYSRVIGGNAEGTLTRRGIMLLWEFSQEKGEVDDVIQPN